MAQVLALDDVIGPDRDVGLIHLDIEGYEIEALKGALRTLRRCRPLLVLETVPKDQWFIQEVLLALGYQAVRRVDGNTVFEAGMTTPPPSKKGIRMFHSAKHQLGVFVCHKCGSGTVLQWLYILEEGLSLAECRKIKAFHPTAEQRFEADVTAHPEVHRMAVVRNPYHRLVSCYFDKIANPQNRWLFARREATLEDFVSWLEQGDHLNCQSHWRPQSRQIGEYDTLIRLEEWNRGLVALEQRLNLPHFDEAFINTKETFRLYSGDWRAFLSPNLAARIYHLYKEDFTRFGYSSDYALAE